jgi:hypothetical protein
VENGLQVRKRLMRKIADLIDENPSSVASALEYSNTFFKYPYTEKELVDTTAHALVNDPLFRENISVVIAYDENNLLRSDFSNIGGKKTKLDAGKETGEFAKTVGKHTASWSGGGVIGLIVGAVVGAVDASFSLGRKKKEAQRQEEIAKMELYAELFDKKKKRNKNWWIPVAVVGGVLVLGGVAVFIALKKK